eukprot:8862574-Pyramimonas_sp.AAC.1
MKSQTETVNVVRTCTFTHSYAHTLRHLSPSTPLLAAVLATRFVPYAITASLSLRHSLVVFACSG